MAKGYWIAHIDVTDRSRYDMFVEDAAEAIDRIGGKILVRSEDCEIAYGTAKTRTVLVEFPTFADALSLFEDPQNVAARDLLNGFCEIDMIIVPGVDAESSDSEQTSAPNIRHLATSSV